MSQEDREDTTIYAVVVNKYEQYSIWPAGRELPLGWSDAGFQGTKEQCMKHIELIWTDERPWSVHHQIEEAGGYGAEGNQG